MRDGVEQEVTQQTIVEGLYRLGLSAGDQVMVHSSLTSFGRVTGGPETVIRALMEVLTPEGTLMMPSFNHGKAFHADGSGVFDPQATPTTNGAIPQAFWQVEGVCRSLNPTHSFAAWGRHARTYIEGHHRTLTCGPDSPLGLLARAGGYGLLMGVDYRSNTFHHVVETMLGAPCIEQRTVALPIRLPDGRIVEGRTWNWRASACPITDPALYAEEIERGGLERRTTIGRSMVRCFRLMDTFPVIAQSLRKGLGGLPPCKECPIRPQRLVRTVPSDWIEATARVAPDSRSWSY